MGAMKKAVIMSLLVTFAACQVEHSANWLGGVLDFLRNMGVLKAAQSFMSEFGLPMEQRTTQFSPHVKSKKMVQRSIDGGSKGWQYMHLCHKECQPWDEACHLKCPKPWDAIEKTCDEVKTLKTCHTTCAHDFACHKRCPMPSCAHKQQIMQQSLDCHQQCNAARGGRLCHAACPKPLKRIADRCEKFQAVRACHRACGKGDPSCHIACRDTSPFRSAHRYHDNNSKHPHAFMQSKHALDGQHIEVEHAVTVAVSFELDVQV